MTDPWLQMYRMEALTKQGGRCAYCKSQLPARMATADHRLPRSRYGGTNQKNIAAACARCNKTKGSMSDRELYKLLDRSRPLLMSDERFLLMWISRRIEQRAIKACARIERLAR